jgi:CRISPR-associated protein Csx16
MTQLLIITRHTGLLDWLAARGISGRVITHLADDGVAPGDIVIGTLPVHLAAKITAIGALYIHVRIDVPERLRGQELDEASLEQLEVSLLPLAVSALRVSDISKQLPPTLISVIETKDGLSSTSDSISSAKSPKG